MYLTTITTALMALGTALASNLDVRDEGGPQQSTLACIYMTTELGWKGEGQNFCQVSGWCSNQMPGGLTAQVSSAGPDEGRTCFLYDNVNCTGTRSAPIVNPGYSNLGDIGFDNRAKSWICWKYCGYTSSSSSAASSSTSPTPAKVISSPPPASVPVSATVTDGPIGIPLTTAVHTFADGSSTTYTAQRRAVED